VQRILHAALRASSLYADKWCKDTPNCSSGIPTVALDFQLSLSSDLNVFLDQSGLLLQHVVIARRDTISITRAVETLVARVRAVQAKVEFWDEILEGINFERKC